MDQVDEPKCALCGSRNRLGTVTVPYFGAVAYLCDGCISLVNNTSDLIRRLRERAVKIEKPH